MKHSEYLTTRKIALVATFSALYYVLSYLPGIKVVAGTANVSIQIEAFMASVFGLMMGPYLGALTAFMGAFLAWMLPPGTPSLTSAVFLPAPMINAFAVGLIYTGKWKMAFVTLAAVVSAFWFLPVAQPWDQYSYIGFYAMWDKIVALMFIIPSAMLVNKMAKRALKAPGGIDIAATPMGKIDSATILSGVAAIFLLANAWIVAPGKSVKFPFDFLGTTFTLSLVLKEVLPIVAFVGYAWLLLGAGVLACAILMYFKPAKRPVWSTLVFLLSCISVVIGGGFLVGLFLGVLGGILGFVRRRFALRRATILGDVVAYFLLAFIGNEADNALGNDIFAIPLVYEGIFQTPLPALRVMFIVGPFFYFAVRLLQAVITTLIAAPLLRNLKAAGLSASQLTDIEKHETDK